MTVSAKEFRVPLDEYEAACDQFEGFCTSCNEVTNAGVEPDARDVVCESCGDSAVFGVEEALLAGLITLG